MEQLAVDSASRAISREQQLRAALEAFVLANADSPTYQLELHHYLAPAPATDVWNARRIFARFGRDLHFVSDWGVWLVWNGKQWKKDEYGLIVHYAKEMSGYIFEEAGVLAPPKLTQEQAAALDDLSIKRRKGQDAAAAELAKWARTSQSKHALFAAIELLKSEPGVTVRSEELDANGKLLNFPNGTLDLDTLDFRQHDRADLITKLTGCLYDPEAKCPQWDAFMVKVCAFRAEPGAPYVQRPDLVRYIRAVSGCGLYGEILDEALAIYHGIGGNGKTVHVEVLKEVIGDFAATATADLFTAKQNEGISNDIARLVGVRFLSASETQEGKFLDEALVKGLTGGDRRTARFLRQEFFEFVPRFTPVLLTNYPPVIRGTDSGIWRRLKLVPWDYDFVSDPEREDKPAVMARLRSEGSGIMNWLLLGLFDRRNAGSLDALEPAVVRDATQRYRDDSDMLGQFILETLWADPTEEIAKDALYTLYADYAKAGGFNALSKRTLGAKLLMLKGWKDKKSTGGKRVWIGWRARTDEDVDPEPPAPAPAPETTSEEWKGF